MCTIEKWQCRTTSEIKRGERVLFVTLEKQTLLLRKAAGFKEHYETIN